MFEGFERGLDIALLIMLGYFFLRGIFRGVVKEIVAIMGVFVAFWVAGLYWPIGDEYLKTIFDLPGHRGVVSFTLIFVVVYFLIGIISIFVDKIVKITISPIVSAILGAALGPVKGVLVCAVLMVGVQAFIKPDESFFTKSQLWPRLQPITQQAQAWLPKDLRQAMEAKRSHSGLNERYRPEAAADRGGASDAPASVKTDWGTIKNLLATRPGDISPEWKEKLRSIPGDKSLSEEDIKRFVAAHPALFSTAPVSPAGTGGPAQPETGPAQPEASPPNWPRPAE